MPGDRYEILGSIGAGAAANVFRVRDLRTGAIRAAKVLKTDRAASADTVARFEDEFRILRTLHHPHLPEVYDYGWTPEGGRYLVMEMVDGDPLDRYFATHPEDIWVILHELCETLVFVHARDLLHQDIKPSNILVTRVATPHGERPLVKLIDFGLTYQRGSGAAVRLVGTAEYVAPEVVRGEKTLTRAVDYYSLGATLFELLCGAPPFVGSENDVLRAHLEREPVIEREELEWAELYPHVRALLAKAPQARLAAFEEFRRAVVGRLTGGIEDLDRSYALARIDSLGRIGKSEAWDALRGWLSSLAERGAGPNTASMSGVEGVGKRFLSAALRAEAAVRGVRTVTPAAIVAVRSDVAVARQPALMWSRLLEMCEKEPVILVVERPHALPDEERSFVRLAGTQWELSRSRGRVLPLFFLVAVDSTTDDAEVLDYLPSENAIKLDLRHLTGGERDEIVAQFRGSMFDTRDARALSTYLARFEDTGSAIQGLQQAVLRAGLTFTGQRWKVQPSLLTDMVKTGKSAAFSQDLVASLTPVERRIAAVVAAHPEPVPVAWVAEFAGVDPEGLPSIIGGSLKRLTNASSEMLSPATLSIRNALRAGCDAPELRAAHQFLASKVASLDRTVANDRALAHHYEQLGRVRDAARVHLRLLHAYWRTRPRERPYELIEGVCRSGLELLATHGRTVTVPTRRHLFCFYLKEWIKALWARNLFTHAKGIIDEWTSRLGEEMPASVVPRYVRSVLDIEGPAVALSLVSDLNRRYLHSAQLAARLNLERALCMHNRGDYENALGILDTLVGRELLSLRDSYRHEIYKAMNRDEMAGRSGQAFSAELMEEAQRSGCADEAVLMRALKARSRIAAGHFRDALHDIALGLRVAQRTALYSRSNLLYRLAAASYIDLNEVTRVRACQERALTLAGAVGIRYLVATSWSRLSENERTAGRYGNALRCSERALQMVGENSPERDTTQAYFAAYAVQVVLRTTGRSAWERSVAKRTAAAKGPNDRGYYFAWLGRDLALRGKLTDALTAFKKAQANFAAAGYSMNEASAALLEARVHLDLSQRAQFRETLDRVEKLVSGDAPPVAELDFKVVKLNGCYRFRDARRASLQLARECEAMLERVADVSLKIETLQALIRTYSRFGLVEESLHVFGAYQNVVREVVANTDPEHAAAVVERFRFAGMAEEYRIVMRQKSKRDPAGSLLLPA